MKRFFKEKTGNEQKTKHFPNLPVKKKNYATLKEDSDRKPVRSW